MKVKYIQLMEFISRLNMSLAVYRNTELIGQMKMLTWEFYINIIVYPKV